MKTVLKGVLTFFSLFLFFIQVYAGYLYFRMFKTENFLWGLFMVYLPNLIAIAATTFLLYLLWYTPQKIKLQFLLQVGLSYSITMIVVVGFMELISKDGITKRGLGEWMFFYFLLSILGMYVLKIILKNWDGVKNWLL